MGLLDVFRGKKKTEAPPPSPSIATPSTAKIAAFAPADGVGNLALEDGTAMRFGRSACRGFEPVVDAKVVVNNVQPHPLGGLRATEIILDPESSDYDDLLAKRDADLGVTREPLSEVEQVAATCETIGWIAVFVNDPPPKQGPQAFQQWAERMGLPQKGIRVSTDGEFRLGVGSHDAILYLGDAPYPTDRLQGYHFVDGFDVGKGFVGLSLGLPGMLRTQRLITARQLDPWGEDGMLRALSRIALALLENGTGVLLPVAGTFRTGERFAQLLGDLDDVSLKPFGAWVGWALDPEMRLYASYGMALQGLPDVGVFVDPEDRWNLDRAQEAILFAGHKMTWEDRELEEGESLDVPVGVPVGSSALPDSPVDKENYKVKINQQDDGHHAVELVHQGEPLGTRALWWQASDSRRPDESKIHPETYAKLFQLGLYGTLDAYNITGLTPDLEPNTPPFEVEVLEAEDGTGFYMATVGLGRKRQLGGEVDLGTAHVELVAAMSDHHPLLASAIGVIGNSIHQHEGGDGVFKVGDTVGLQLTEIGAEGFVLADAGQVEMADGAPVHLLELVPVSAEEYQHARTTSSSRLLESLPPISPSSRADRWRLMLT